MKPVTVFYDGKIYMEADEWIKSQLLPVGAYVCSDNCWYRIVGRPGKPQFHSMLQVNKPDIPKWVKAWCLIL